MFNSFKFDWIQFISSNILLIYTFDCQNNIYQPLQTTRNEKMHNGERKKEKPPREFPQRR